MAYIGKILTRDVDKNTKIIFIISDDNAAYTILIQHKNKIYDYSLDEEIDGDPGINKKIVNSVNIWEIDDSVNDIETLEKHLNDQHATYYILIDSKKIYQ